MAKRSTGVRPLRGAVASLLWLSACVSVTAQGNDSLRVDSLRQAARLNYERGAYGLCVETLEPLAQQWWFPDSIRIVDGQAQPMGGADLSLEDLHRLYYSYQRSGQREDMYYWGERIVKRFPDDGEVVADMARCYNEDEKYDLAMRTTAFFTIKHPEHLLVMKQYADASFLKMYIPIARPIYHELLDAGMQTYDVCYSLGLCYFSEEKYDTAYTYLRQAAEINKFKNSNCLYRLGVACVESGRCEEGIPYLQKALDQLMPDRELLLSIHELLARGFEQTGQDTLAAEELKQCVTVFGGGGDTRLHFRLAKAYERIGDTDNARYSYRQFLNMAYMIGEDKRPEELKLMIRQAEFILNNKQ